MKRVVILNSPPNGGKDVGANHLVSLGTGWFGTPIWKREFKSRLFDITKAVYGVSHSQWEAIYTREGKEKSSPLLDGLSPRQALIKVSEEVIKPVYGKEFFGGCARDSLMNGINIFSDGGFTEELRPILTEVGYNNILIVRVFRDGCSFGGDSRDYLPLNLGPRTVDVYNNSSEWEYFTSLEKEIGRWLYISQGVA